MSSQCLKPVDIHTVTPNNPESRDECPVPRAPRIKPLFREISNEEEGVRLKSGSLLLAAASALSALVALPLFSHPVTVSAEDTLVDRGRYLTMAGACMECHSERAGSNPFELNQKMLYAGGEEFSLPIG